MEVGGGGVDHWYLAATVSLDTSTHNVFNINNLSTDKNFDFINSLHSSYADGTKDNYFNSCSDSPYDRLYFNCLYSSPADYRGRNNDNELTIMSFNIQSLNAKFSDLCELIELLQSNDSAPDILCLQELWQFPSDANFSILGYSKLEYKLRRNCTQGGGVGIFIKSALKYSINVMSSIFIDRILESIFIEVTTKDNKKIIIGSVYRPSVNHPSLSTSEQYNQFSEIFSNLLSSLTNEHSNVIIVGDFNLDVLR